jgi:hypothetical protein
MRVLSVLLALAAIAAAQSVQDPAKLEVIESGGSLSYKVTNQSSYRIVGFMIATHLTSPGFEGLSCTVSVEVKSPKDLTANKVCQLPTDEKTGKPVTYSSRIVHVNFSNGLTWTPVTESQFKNANP